MKVIICGCRYFDNREFIYRKLDYMFSINKPQLVILGGAKGVDTIARDWCLANQINHLIIPAKWRVHKKRAGPLRNIEMSKLATHTLAFWDHESRGTRHMIQYSKKVNLTLKVVSINDLSMYNSNSELMYFKTSLINGTMYHLNWMDNTPLKAGDKVVFFEEGTLQSSQIYTVSSSDNFLVDYVSKRISLEEAKNQRSRNRLVRYSRQNQ